MTRPLVQIVAGLPPAIDGVGDYALAIARALREQQEIQTLFVVADPTWRGPKIVEGFPVGLVARKNPGSLLLAMREVLTSGQAGPTTPILFHCSLYGYAPRALAFWLQRGFAQWKRESPGSPLITMFHELAANGPIWTSAFWLHGTQCRLIERFARESTASLTTNARYRQHLARIAGIEESNIVKLPVLSNVGELGELAPARSRKRQLVVFGKRHPRDLAFSSPLLKSVCGSFGIERVLEVGPGAVAREHWPSTAVEATGALSAGEVSAILRDSLFGFIALDASLLSKSTVFAAYCAHGTIPIVAGRDGGKADGLFANQQYLCAPLQGRLGSDRLEAVSQAAYTWYRGHGVAAQASQYARVVDEVSQKVSLNANVN